MTLRPCDICGADPARTPFRYQRAGGRRAQKPGERPLFCCPDPACIDAAEARWRAANALPGIPAKPAASMPRPAPVIGAPDLFSKL